jgi:hypothetical protein
MISFSPMISVVIISVAFLVSSLKNQGLGARDLGHTSIEYPWPSIAASSSSFSFLLFRSLLLAYCSMEASPEPQNSDNPPSINKTWSHLFKSSIFSPMNGSNTPSFPQVSQISQSAGSQAEQLAAFVFCQNRLLAFSGDITKMIQDVSSTFTQDKENLTTFLGSVKELMETCRQGNRTQLEEIMNNSIIPGVY